MYRLEAKGEKKSVETSISFIKQFWFEIAVQNIGQKQKEHFYGKLSLLNKFTNNIKSSIYYDITWNLSSDVYVSTPAVNICKSLFLIHDTWKVEREKDRCFTEIHYKIDKSNFILAKKQSCLLKKTFLPPYLKILVNRNSFDWFWRSILHERNSLEVIFLICYNNSLKRDNPFLCGFFMFIGILWQENQLSLKNDLFFVLTPHYHSI